MSQDHPPRASPISPQNPLHTNSPNSLHNHPQDADPNSHPQLSDLDLTSKTLPTSEFKSQSSVPFYTAMERLYDTLTEAEEFFEDLYYNFLEENSSAQAYARQVMMDELWKCKLSFLVEVGVPPPKSILSIFYPRHRSSSHATKNENRPTNKVVPDEYIKRVYHDLEQVYRARWPSQPQVEGHPVFGVDANELDRLKMNIFAQYRKLLEIRGTIYSAHLFIRELELLWIYMDKNQAWQLHSNKGSGSHGKKWRWFVTL